MAENEALFYIKRPSVFMENAPLLIMLHGFGSDENDLFSFASELPEKLFIISVRAPITMQPFGNAWYAIHFEAPQGKWSDTDQAIASRDLVANFIDEICAKYPVDPKNVTLLGFSQGTILSYAVSLTYPQKVKNIIALSGYIDKNMIIQKENFEYSHLDFYCSHGSMDQVLPVEWARQSGPFLKSLNIKYQYSEYPVGHGVAPQNFYEFREWLKARI